ncbi:MULTISPECIES: alpha/beta fold hydrolase [unclassified Aliiroseovarius]|uniref:alpha/beta fold hydrolase n=1 Tax=unclassified Aliiroseovarius TaxID=2623558 RepID=UPI001568D475|nr:MULTISPECIES: alpha/beta hydrolase [unclassified Aliiroseovarius]NRP13214.1 Rhodomycin D methylesterase DauP [Aliiroseovarius sp. xm-d-517]NRP30236.1 Rhodomycin D methylesterase DauP [Aliiroseovarius sp. xm-m-314]NRP40311.1 Rhodomycin D methylesterase DauP [Aliiroseovarius sp. xm-m-339-2]NRP43052.1 Rhodomycin D methylesterase DauP [Aliiroseovarius sp. xm-m-378]NRP61317.1 Rhodomycin D methylesterase DauP [Aliiroseovarius sp. xm-a-151]
MPTTNAYSQVAQHAPLHLHHWEAGDPAAHPVVLLVGLGMQAVEWPKPFIGQLARTHRVICIDNRDAGKSPHCGPDSEPEAARIWLQEDIEAASQLSPYTLFDMRDDVLAVLEKLKIDRFDLVGFSMGGMIGQLVAAAAGSRVTNFVQLSSNDGTAEVDGSADAKRRMARLFSTPDDPNIVREYLLDDALAYGAGRLEDGPELRAEIDEIMVEGYSCGGAARHALAVLTTPDRRDLLAHIQARTLVAHGTKDLCISPERGKIAADLIPGASFRLLPDVGHILDKDLCEATLVWLQSDTRHADRIGDCHGVA